MSQDIYFLTVSKIFEFRYIETTSQANSMYSLLHVNNNEYTINTYTYIRDLHYFYELIKFAIKICIFLRSDIFE